jgi:ABC-type phosphate transport system substrate-binding protein
VQTISQGSLTVSPSVERIEFDLPRGRPGLAALGFALFAIVAYPAGVAHAASVPINGGGAIFPALQIGQWQSDTAGPPYSLSVNYTAQNSGYGRQHFLDGTLDFGVSDTPLSPLELSQLQAQRCVGQTLSTCFTHIPIAAAGLGFMYNVIDNSGSRVTNLQLTRDETCKIFTGQITRSSGQATAAKTPGYVSNSWTTTRSGALFTAEWINPVGPIDGPPIPCTCDSVPDSHGTRPAGPDRGPPAGPNLVSR